MKFLIIGLVVFFSIHLLPTFSTMRRRIVDGFGQVSYTSIFSLVALSGIGLIVFGKIYAEYIPIWDPPFWAVMIPVAVMPFVFILFLAAFYPSNIRRVIHNPLLLSVLLWSFAHLVVNGDLASILLFGSFALYCLIDWLSLIVRKHSQTIGLSSSDSELKQSSYSKSKDTPPSSRQRPATPQKKYSFLRDGLIILLGLATFMVVLYFHNTLFGVTTFGAN